ncbi:MAG: DUF2585 domain-containing protein [bacterium]|nr:DUF2585 domain-containing protein [bacterium]
MSFPLKINKVVLICIGIILLQAVLLFAMGHPWICKCEFIKLWEGNPNSSNNSQHLTDWYTYSHVIHGFIFYFLLWLFPATRKLSFFKKLGIAIFVESFWEVLENTPFIINRYRAATISLDYFGDSVINSVSDTIFMIVGYIASYKLPVWSIVVTAIFFELFVLYFIRDNLTLNIIMLVYPLDAIRIWQGGG